MSDESCELPAKPAEDGTTTSAMPAPAEVELPYRPEIRAAAEPSCCGSGCANCPF